MSAQKSRARLPVIGWREWIALPRLGVGAVKAKVDTGARSSSLHAWDLETFRRRGVEMVRFSIHPLQRDSRTEIVCETAIHDERLVRSSSGQSERRIVVITEVELLGLRWPVELNLARRDSMGFRMLLGRQAIRGRFVVDSGRSFYSGEPQLGDS
ncbi:MAG TPA: RimK/LysX family protein [Planctomycetota bacterium]